MLSGPTLSKGLGASQEKLKAIAPTARKWLPSLTLSKGSGLPPLHFCHFAHMCSPQGSANNLHSLGRHELPPKYTASTIDMPGVHLEALCLDKWPCQHVCEANSATRPVNRHTPVLKKEQRHRFRSSGSRLSPNFDGIRVPGEPLRLQSLFNMPLARLQGPS